MFQAFKQKTAELKDRTRQRFNTASEQGRKLRENVESLTGVDKARERYAQARNPIGGSSTAARLGGFSGAATAANSLSAAFSKIGSSPYKKTKETQEDTGAGDDNRVDVVQTPAYEQSPVAKHPTAPAAEDVLATLDPGFYLPEDEFDPIRHTLESITKKEVELTTELLHGEEEHLSQVVEAVSTKLAKEVLAHYGDFVAGMKSITELTDNLEQSFVIVKNGRRNLASAKDSVAGALKVAESRHAGSCTGMPGSGSKDTLEP